MLIEGKLRCLEKDPVWDRQCEKAPHHILADIASERLHINVELGDTITWGTIADMKAYEKERGY